AFGAPACLGPLLLVPLPGPLPAAVTPLDLDVRAHAAEQVTHHRGGGVAAVRQVDEELVPAAELDDEVAGDIIVSVAAVPVVHALGIHEAIPELGGVEGAAVHLGVAVSDRCTGGLEVELVLRRTG